ncbi:MAG: hypothetical protein E7483_02465 [Ruminococcaceae bacterium]|nr:hypothetical protein [Oscillospiraceae bacterium]
METGTPFIIEPSESPENFAENNSRIFSYSKTNIWNSSFESPEISCDFQLLHQDLTEIKNLICDIRDSIKDFFAER